MKTRFFKFLTALSCLLCLVAQPALVLAASSNELSQNCAQAQNYLEKTQKTRDIKARVDRLQAYNYIYQRLDKFTDRLEHNKQPDSKEMRQHLDDFKSDVDTFTRDYETYNTARDKSAGLGDCAHHTAEFQKLLTSARGARSQVSNDVTRLDNQLTGDLKNQLDNLYRQLLSSGTTGGVTNE